MAPFKVIIVGGGLSGTLLANGLLNNNVDFMLYERDRSDSKRDGYQIRLGESAMIGFRSCLTDSQIGEIKHKFGQSVGASATAPTIYTSRFKPILDLTSLPTYTKSSAINRVTLRNLLMENVQKPGKVAFSKDFSHYTIIHGSDGVNRVKVFFTDGTADTADILVGADGSGSQINQQVGARNLVSIQSHSAFLAKGDLPLKRIKELPSPLQKGPIMCFTNKGNLYYALYLPPKKDSTKAFLDINDYEQTEASFYWALVIPRTAYRSNDPNDIHEKRKFCLDYIRDWAPEYHKMLSIDEDNEDTAEVKIVPLRASRKLSKMWREKLRERPENKEEEGHPQVWLLGDAVHAMQPNRGQGGNQAMHDCASMLPQLLLLDELAKDGSALSIDTIYHGCLEYEKEMIERAFGWVQKSGGTSVPSVNLDGIWGFLIYLSAKILLPIIRMIHRLIS